MTSRRQRCERLLPEDGVIDAIAVEIAASGARSGR